MRVVTARHGKLQTVISEVVVSHNRNAVRTGLTALDRICPGNALATGAIHELLFVPGRGLPLFFAAFLARRLFCPTQGSGFRVQGSGGMANDETRSPKPERMTNDEIQMPTCVRTQEVARYSEPGAQHSALSTQDSALSTQHRRGAVVWIDPDGILYPPALAAAGLPLERILLLRVRRPADQVWAIAECLGCPGVRVTVASPPPLSRIEARRLQLAAERGGGAGILLRPLGAASAEHAAVTRWLVKPAPGERNVQRWELELIHGHGGRVGATVILEACRETHLVRAFEPVADRPVEKIA